MILSGFPWLLWIDRGSQYSSIVIIQEVNSKFEVFEELVLKTVFME